MRNILILMLLTVFQVFAENSYSQITKLTVELEEVTVSDVLDAIEEQSEFYFLCNKKLVDVNRKVSIYIEDEDIKEILAQVFNGTDVRKVRSVFSAAIPARTMLHATIYSTAPER